ncbi:MAG TPA: hypothetical protein VFS63_11465 [Pseudolabrys sp.]|nr:hypothetical protein [Pseudolabrys sp.]
MTGKRDGKIRREIVTDIVENAHHAQLGLARCAGRRRQIRIWLASRKSRTTKITGLAPPPAREMREPGHRAELRFLNGNRIGVAARLDETGVGSAADVAGSDGKCRALMGQFRASAVACRGSPLY